MSAAIISTHPARVKLPAYGKEILVLRKCGMVPARAVRVIVDAWEWGKAFPRIVVPYDMEPEAVDFSILAGLDVICAWSPLKTAFKRVDAIMRAILRSGPAFLYVMNMDKPDASFMVLASSGKLELPEYSA